MNETLPKRSQVAATTTAARAIPVKKEEGIPWERIESTSKPGHYYYFNPITGALSVIFSLVLGDLATIAGRVAGG